MRDRGSRYSKALWQYCQDKKNEGFNYPRIHGELSRLAGAEIGSSDWDSARGFGLIIGPDEAPNRKVPDPSTIAKNVRRFGDHKGEGQAVLPNVKVPAVNAQKLEQILSTMWVPDPDTVALTIDRSHMGLNERFVENRWFRWLVGEGVGVTRVWVDQREEAWLLERFFPSLEDGEGGQLAVNWRQLQKDMSDYLRKSSDYSFAVNVLLEYRGSVADVLWNIENGTGYPDDHPALFLDYEHGRLGSAVAQFKHEVSLYLDP